MGSFRKANIGFVQCLPGGEILAFLEFVILVDLGETLREPQLALRNEHEVDILVTVQIYLFFPRGQS